MSHFDAPNPVTAFQQGIAFNTHKAGGDSQSGDPEIGTWWSYVRGYSDILLGAYWVLRPDQDGDMSADADAFLAKLDDKCPTWRDREAFILQLDCENWNGDTDTVPSLAEINEFADRLVSRTSGRYVPVVYAPRWVYPDVAGCRYPIWASSYVGGSGAFMSLYPGDTSSHWNAYGKPISILQYSSKAVIGGQSTSDANAFRGTLAELKHLVTPGSSIVTSPVDLTIASVNAVAAASAAAVVARPLGASGPTVGVALQTGAYANTEALLTAVAALDAKVTAAGVVDLDALAALIVAGLVEAGVGGVTEDTLVEVLESAQIAITIPATD
jgi:GH25 family lysozyme M1 (1,4-beta-N-acetylmuramidase)/energy-converting hydrogenase Eha subunit E